ncbi:bifunctional ADP-dependent NAD(P)H-hydrate dehydratase/NAD(P)H-hydrate epimerase [Georgenia sp. H159]|uniref:bifunctional ADP-dependent NAD(P)H-hydrate dehydratase/NAD(P)H-hydrate epimerase n=1 Tax=Georgenia sp. H159 TaxID=3076115 RepID=UPI002D76806B|nr:NAD(P)H-hydrate dehydratase [Georgenia sp. H159]
MIRAYEAEAVRAAEAPLLAATAPDELMKQAAFAVATAVLDELRRLGARRSGSTVLLLVGGGNNGGDALYAGAYLARRGLQVAAALCTDRPHERGLAAARSAGVRCHDVLDDAGRPRWVVLGALADRGGVWVDGLTGIGATGGLRQPLADVVTGLWERRTAMPDEPTVVAVDVPSGIGVDDGTLPGPVLRADVTVTMGAAKPGLLVRPAEACVGRLVVVDIGLTAGLGTPAVRRLTAADVADLRPAPGPADHKYTRGVLGLLAGSTTYPGAAVLAAAGALRAGLGMVRYLGPDTVARLVHQRFPEVVVGSGRVQSWTVGSGVDPDDAERADDVRGVLTQALADGVPAVLDAGALALAPERLAPNVVLTPHAGELARLLSDRGEETARGDVDAEPLRLARLAAGLTGAVVLLKGPTTVVAAPGGATFAQADGTPWLATAGTGDVLAGVLGALLAGHGEELTTDEDADGARTAELAAAAAYLHGRAGLRASGGGPVTALQVADAVSAVVAELGGT